MVKKVLAALTATAAGAALPATAASGSVTPSGNRFGLPAFYSLHLWLRKQNPAGEFAMWNPEVSCT